MSRIIEWFLVGLVATIVILVMIIVNLVIAEHRECEQIKREYNELKK